MWVLFEAPTNSEELSMQTITTIGFDIAKSVFQVHGVDAFFRLMTKSNLIGCCTGWSAGLDRPISITAINVASCSRAMRDLLKSFGRDRHRGWCDQNPAPSM
jgi:hypothetical protein